MKLEIKKLGINGEGIAYQRRVPVFVKGALPGEVVEARVSGGDSFLKGELLKVVKPCGQRVDSPCPYSKECGACGLIHANYALQLEAKKAILEESLAKYAGIDAEVEIIANEQIFGYRNELKMPFGYRDGRLVTGLYSVASNRFVALDNCLIHDPLLERLRKRILEVLNDFDLAVYDRKLRRGLRFLILRMIDGRAQLCLVTGDDLLPKELIKRLSVLDGLQSIYQSVNTSRDAGELFGRSLKLLWGERFLELDYEGLKINLSMRSFYQLNSLQTHKLYGLVTAKVKADNELIVEAYSGVGIMSLLLAKRAKRIVGIEYIRDAVDNANNNAKINGMANLSFVAGDSAEVISRMFRKNVIDYLIVDPPRSGLDEAMLATLLHAKINNIIYVSCSPSSLAKNLAVLKQRYYINSIEAIDMFSNSAHVETVVLLSRKIQTDKTVSFCR